MSPVGPNEGGPIFRPDFPKPFLFALRSATSCRLRSGPARRACAASCRASSPRPRRLGRSMDRPSRFKPGRALIKRAVLPDGSFWALPISPPASRVLRSFSGPARRACAASCRASSPRPRRLARSMDRPSRFKPSRALIKRAVLPDGSFWALLGLNQRPTDYESAALTAELRARVIGKRSVERFPITRRNASRLVAPWVSLNE